MARPPHDAPIEETPPLVWQHRPNAFIKDAKGNVLRYESVRPVVEGEQKWFVSKGVLSCKTPYGAMDVGMTNLNDDAQMLWDDQKLADLVTRATAGATFVKQSVRSGAALPDAASVPLAGQIAVYETVNDIRGHSGVHYALPAGTPSALDAVCKAEFKSLGISYDEGTTVKKPRVPAATTKGWEPVVIPAKRER